MTNVCEERKHAPNFYLYEMFAYLKLKNKDN